MDLPDQDLSDSGPQEPRVEPLNLHRSVELRLIAEDAMWLEDAIHALSALPEGQVSLGAFCIYPHASRIVHESVKHLGRTFPQLADDLNLKFGEYIESARHSVKLFDDRKRGLDGVVEWFESENAVAQRNAFTGNVRWKWLQRFETDMGQYIVDDCLTMTNHVIAYSTAMPLEALADEALQQPFFYGASFSMGQIVGTLADAFRGDRVGSIPAIGSLRGYRTRDVRTETFLESKFDPTFSLGLKLALVAMQCGLNSVAKVLAHTEKGHEAALLRVRLVALSHVLSAVSEIRRRFGDTARSSTLTILDQVLSDPIALVVLESCRPLRNVSMHYGVDPSWGGLDLQLPMSGLVETLVRGSSFSRLSDDLRELTARVSAAFNTWSHGR